MGVAAAVAMWSLMDDPDSLCLVGECRELEECFGTNYTDSILAGADEVSMDEVKRVVKQADGVRRLEKCADRAPLIAEVVNRGGSWIKLWDATLHLGTRHTDGFRDAGTSWSCIKACCGLLLCDKSSLNDNPIGHLLREHQLAWRETLSSQYTSYCPILWDAMCNFCISLESFFSFSD